MTDEPTLYGYDASTYTRIARIVLAEKGVAHSYVRVADWSGYEKRPGFGGLHPFRKVPVLDHGDLRLFETAAIIDYIDRRFDGPALQPDAPEATARMRQVLSVYDSYAFRPWVQVIVTERLFLPAGRTVPDMDAIREALPPARRAAGAIGDLLARRNPGFDLAAAYLAPAVAFLAETPEGAEILAETRALSQWWTRIATRPAARGILRPVAAMRAAAADASRGTGT